MNKSEQIGALAAALARAQGEFSVVPLNSRNPHLGNRYADLGDVIHTAKPILAKNELSVSQTVFGDGGVVGVTTILLHSSGEWISDQVTLAIDEQKGLKTAQVAGSLISYLRRYSYASILGLYADEDTDGNDHKPQQQTKAAQQPTSGAAATPAPTQPTNGTTPPNDGITEAQLRAIWAAGKGRGYTAEQIKEGIQSLYGRSIRELTKAEASEYIDLLKQEQQNPV